MAKATETAQDIATRLRADAAIKQLAANELAEKDAAKIQATLFPLLVALQEVARQPSGGLRVYVRRELDASKRMQAIMVSVSRFPLGVGQPFAACRATATSSGRMALHLCRPNAHTTRLGSQLQTILASERTAADCDKIVSTVKLFIAQCINSPEKGDYEIPTWYRLVGNALGWPLALVTYAALALGFGLVGVLSGWIAAWLVLVLSRFLWLPAVALGALAMLRG